MNHLNPHKKIKANIPVNANPNVIYAGQLNGTTTYNDRFVNKNLCMNWAINPLANPEMIILNNQAGVKIEKNVNALV